MTYARTILALCLLPCFFSGTAGAVVIVLPGTVQMPPPLVVGSTVSSDTWTASPTTALPDNFRFTVG